LQGSANGSAVYAETHAPQTNANGLATLEIGGGTLFSGNFANINWANGPFFVKTETDPNGGNNYTITNTSQLLSVPYALYAATAGNNTPGPQGPAGQNGANGQNGTNGQNGLSAYQIWLNAGNSGSEAVFLASLQGPAGNPATDDQNLSVSLTGDTLFLQNGGFVIIPGISAANNVGGVSGPLNIETALIPAGTFTMGSPTSEPERYANEVQHQVTLSAFRMSKYETSNAQFAAFLNAKNIASNGLYALGAYPSEPLIYDCGSNNGLSYTGSQWHAATGFEDYPVVCATWFGATEFATYAGGRLPTEAEWEYSCRGNTTTPFNTGACLNNTQANYRWNLPYTGCSNTNTAYPNQTQSINNYSANAYGLYNMHGNVWEWCADWFGDYITSEQTNPVGPSTGEVRVIRGGSWFSNAQDCRSSVRGGAYPDTNDYYFFGFRLAFAP
jgi:formylglycine-generating enzyme required for sulfatase activity